MAKLIFEEIDLENDIKEAGRLIGKHLKVIYNPDKTDQVVYGDVNEDDLELLRGYGYKVEITKAK